MDATIVPRIMSKRGLMIGGEFRYLTNNYYSETQIEIIPDDRERNSGENSERGAFSYYGHGYLTKRLRLDANIKYASDHDYLEDLGDSLAVSSSRYLERRGDLRYYGNDWNILARAQYYQTMDETIPRANRPYARLPQVKFKYNKPDQIGGATLHLDAEYVYFDKDKSVKGQRFDLQPAISFPMRNSWGYLTPKLGARYTSYDLKDEDIDGFTNDSPDRTTGTFSLDGGLFFEKIGDSYTHTLEPRMFYLYTSKEKQDEIPIFDTTAYDFSFYNIFREDRFAGADRVGDANQLALALTSRTYDNETGEESFRFSIGEIFYFEDREVQLPTASATVLSASNDSSSALIGQIAWQMSDNWSTQADLEWDHNRDNNKTAQSAFHLKYDNKKRTLFNLGYRYARDYENDGVLFEQTDLSFRLPITSNINAVGRWDYSLLHDKTMESFAGFEYSNCCWAFRAVGRHYINDIDQDANTAFYLQLELKGLTSIGNKVGEFLEDNLLGYTRAE
jgi:LPS-assembly protein